MVDELLVEVDVGVSPEHAFEVWTKQLGRWWPASHTISGTHDVVIEPFTGGRIYERAADGTEHEWGEVVTWEPPERFHCLWHLFFDRSEATDLEVTFAAIGTGTKVRIRQTGWERLGATGEDRRARTHAAWAVIVGTYEESLASAT